MKYRHITRFGIFFVASMATLVACTDDKKGINDNTPEVRCTESSCGADMQCNTETGKCEDKSHSQQPEGKTCQSNDDCDGMICEAGKCVKLPEGSCLSNDDCYHQYCVQSKCVECTEDEQCDEGGVCENNACKYECTVNDDCQQGFICEAHHCVESWCDDDSGCPDGLVCKDDHHCGLECTTNDECSDNKICSAEHRCIYECEEDTDCSDGLVCKDNHRCGFECTTNEECSDNKICSSEHHCIIECQEDTDCSGDLVCRDNRCAKECIGNEDCGGLKICDNYVCRYECEKDSECSGNAQCVQYRCELECSEDKPCISSILPHCSDQNRCVACLRDEDCEGEERACDLTTYSCKNRCDIITCDEETEICNREIGQCEAFSCLQMVCGDEDCFLDENKIPHCTAVDTCDFANDNDCDGINNDVDPCPYNPHVNSVEEGKTAECNIFTYDEVTVFEIWHASDLNRLKNLGTSGLGPNMCVTNDNNKPCSEIRLMRNINFGDVSTAEDVSGDPTKVNINGEDLVFEDAACHMNFGALPDFVGTDAEHQFVFDGLNHTIEAYKADGTRCAMTHGLFERLLNAELRNLTLKYDLYNAKSYITNHDFGTSGSNFGEDSPFYGCRNTTFSTADVQDSLVKNVHINGNIILPNVNRFGAFAMNSYHNVYDDISYTGSVYNKNAIYGLVVEFSQNDTIDHLVLDVDKLVATSSGGLVAYDMNECWSDGKYHGFIKHPKFHVGTVYSNRSFSMFAYSMWFEHIQEMNEDDSYDVVIDNVAYVGNFYGGAGIAYGGTTFDGLRVKIGSIDGGTCYLMFETSWGAATVHNVLMDIGTLRSTNYNGIITTNNWTSFENIKINIDELTSNAPSFFSNTELKQGIRDIFIEIGTLTVNGGGKSIHAFSQALQDGKNLNVHVKGNILIHGNNNSFYGISSRIRDIENSSFVVDGDLIVDGSNTTIYGLTGDLSSKITNSRMSYGNIIFNGEGGKLYSLVANGQDGSSLSNVDYSIKTIQSEHANTEVNLLAGNLVGTMVDNIRMRIEDNIAVNGNVYIVGRYEKSHLTNAAFELNSVSIGANQFVPFKQVQGEDNIFENIAIYTNVNTSNKYTSGFMGDLMTDQISLKNLSLASRFYYEGEMLDIPAVLHNADTLLDEDGHLDFSGKNGLPYMENVFYNVPAGVSGRACPDSLDCSNATSRGLFFIEYDNKPGAIRLILENYLFNWIRAEFESNGEIIYMPWPKSKTEGENEGGENGETPTP